MYQKGEFICPKCGNKGLGKFKRWISRNEYIGNRLIKKWILYNNSENKWKCCSIITNENWNEIFIEILECKGFCDLDKYGCCCCCCFYCCIAIYLF